MKLKITSGSLKGRFINGPKGDQTRPTSEKVRQSFFNSYRHLLENCSFLDLFAGTGAMGIEAYSCGASKVVLVEKHRLALQVIHQNLSLLQIENKIKVIGKDAIKAIEDLEADDHPFDLIYIDPPYAQQKIKEEILLAIDKSSLIRQGSSIFLEENVHYVTPIEKLPYHRLSYQKTKEIGDTLIHVFTVLNV